MLFKFQTFKVSSSFYVEQFKSFILGGHFGGFIPCWKTPKLGPNNCLRNILHCEFQLSMLHKQFKSFILGGPFGGLPPRGSLNLFKQLFHKHFPTLSFNLLCWAVQRFHVGGHFGRFIFVHADFPKLSMQNADTLKVTAQAMYFWVVENTRQYFGSYSLL